MGITETQLRALAKWSPATVARLSKNEVVNMESLLKITKARNCSVAGLFDSKPDEEETHSKQELKSSERDKPE